MTYCSPKNEEIDFDSVKLVEFWEGVYRSSWHLHSSPTVSDRYWYDMVVRFFKKYAPVRPGLRVLKLDMYNEATSTKYADYYLKGGAEVAFAEISRSIAQQAKHKMSQDGFNSRVHPIQSDFRTLPFKDESFDVSCSFGSIEHTPQWEETIAEQIRVVKKGGVVLVGVPNIYNIWMRYHVNVIADKLKLLEKFTNFEIHFTQDKLRNAVIKHGLKNVEISGYHFFPKILRWMDLYTKRHNEKLNKIFSWLIAPGLSFCTKLENKETRLNLLSENLIAIGVK